MADARRGQKGPFVPLWHVSMMIVRCRLIFSRLPDRLASGASGRLTSFRVPIALQFGKRFSFNLR